MIAKQEQLVHELSTELAAKNGEIRRLDQAVQNYQAEIAALEEKTQHLNLKVTYLLKMSNSNV